jgi:hypothetical protein
MDEVKRKIYLDLFASPVTLLPLVGGLTALMASWAVGGSGLLTFAGLTAVLSGGGIFATRLIFGLEKLADSAYRFALERQHARQQQELQQLHQRLERDNDPRTERLLRHLQQAYQRLESDLREGRITSAAQGVLQSVEQMFAVCVDHLRRSYELWEDSRQADGKRRSQLLRQREELVTEVEQSVDFLDASLEQLRTRNSRRGRSRLARLRDELDESIRIARQTEERLESIGPHEHEMDRE